MIATNVGTLLSGPVVERDVAERLAANYNLALSRRLALTQTAQRRKPEHTPTQWATYTFRF